MRVSVPERLPLLRQVSNTGAGYVRKIGLGTQVAKVGDPVIMSFSAYNDCKPCARGHPAHCMDFNAINFEVVPGNLVFKEGQSTQEEQEPEPDIYGKFFGQSSFFQLVDYLLLSPLRCDMQTGSGAIINAASSGPTDKVAAILLRGVSLSAIMGTRIAECKQIIGIDRHGSRLELAKELGAAHVDATVAVHTTGVPALIAEGVKMTAFKGKFLPVGTAPETGTLRIPIHDFMTYIPKLIDWITEGKLPSQKIVRFYPAEEFETAIRDMRSSQTVKPVIL
ncbi:hypothetical protein BJX61DRAFT_536104 [Aspergillus egyptiacus]|nr:hypothetical protein BJX61DRAFT_536104 [Aspergillus egyptiacus]